MNKITELKLELNKVLDDKIILLKEQIKTANSIIKIQDEQLILSGVSQQRELLIAYEKNHYSFHEWIVLKNQCIRDIDEYLSN